MNPQGQYPGTTPQGYPNPQYPGGQPGMGQPGGYPGGQPGGYPGGYPGGQPGMGQPGGYPGGYPGGQPGMGQPGGFPGGQPGGFPGGQPGGYPGGQPGGYPGGYPGGQPGMQGRPGGYPVGQPGMGGYPGGQPGMGVQPGGFPGGQPGFAVGGQYGGGMAGGAVVSVFQAATTFQVRRNFFAYGGEMDVTMNGVPQFRCISTPSPLGYGHTFNLTDMAGNVLCYIQPDASFGMPHFHIWLRGALYATLKQDWSAREKKFELHNKQTGEHVKVYGDWFAQSFDFERHHGGQVAQVSAGYGGGDMYDITVYPGEDALFILAATLTIEKLCHEHKHHHKHGW